ncbi:MAG TPA: alpha/beta hydrolase-fold protein [Terracidiphilus sp.]|nr:alpha/beta hydrolase-fold protein [Terracidiphilus sp.]
MNPQRQSKLEALDAVIAAPIAPPHPRLRLHRDFTSVYLPDKRDLIVYLPPDYDERAERDYPVLYLQDGQNLFDPETSFVKGRTWQMREQADAAIEAGEVEPLILVGIYNTGDRRLAEYTPDANREMGGGEADQYGLLLTRELIPWMDETYRVLRGREHTGLGGSSLGGLVSLYLALVHPECFGKLAILSPSVWWNRKSILGILNERAPQIWERPRMWLDVGDREGHRTLRDAEQLARRLKANGWRPGETLHFERVEGGTHDETSWATRVRPMLRFLFPGQNSSARDAAGAQSNSKEPLQG